MRGTTPLMTIQLAGNAGPSLRHEPVCEVLQQALNHFYEAPPAKTLRDQEYQWLSSPPEVGLWFRPFSTTAGAACIAIYGFWDYVESLDQWEERTFYAQVTGVTLGRGRLFGYARNATVPAGAGVASPG